MWQHRAVKQEFRGLPSSLSTRQRQGGDLFPRQSLARWRRRREIDIDIRLQRGDKQVVPAVEEHPRNMIAKMVVGPGRPAGNRLGGQAGAVHDLPR